MFYEAWKKKCAITEEVDFIKMLTTQNFDQIRLLFFKYNQIAGHPIESAIETQFRGGDTRDALLALARRIRNRTAYFAGQLDKYTEVRNEARGEYVNFFGNFYKLEYVNFYKLSV